MRNELMTVPYGAALTGKSSEGALLPATQGRAGEAFQRNKDWYQTDTATGVEHKIDNAPQMNVNVRGFEPRWETNQADIVKEALVQARTEAVSAKKDLQILAQSEEALNQGAKTGVLVEPRNYIDKLAVTMGFQSDDPRITATDLFIRTMRQRASAILASGTYGAGTGISQKDLEEVIKVATGKDMTLPGLQAFIKVAKHSNILAIKRYESLLSQAGALPGTQKGFPSFMEVPQTGVEPARTAPVMTLEQKRQRILELERELGMAK